METKRARISIVVLGDLGRSPRMQYHALSLVAELADVDLIGYRGSALPQALREDPRIDVHRLPTPRSLDPRRGPLVWFDALVRFVSQTIALLRLLILRVPRPDLILVQTPPAIPTLGVTWLAARLRSAKLVIDWHNFGYTLLRLKMGERHPMVRILAWTERVQGRRADGHLCVSRQMRTWLEETWGLSPVRVLYDRPAATFAPLPPQQRLELLSRLELTPKTGERQAIVVSSTSWTPDEDFTPLIEALQIYDQKATRSAGRYPQLLMLLTGRGPLRADYETRFASLKLRRVSVKTLWLEPDDYPRFLGSADLGLCCHRSSSGLDLPMKVADMLGAGLPVCALDYGPVLSEQLRPGDNGELFSSGEQLAERLVELLDGFPGPDSGLAELRASLQRRPPRHWHDGWNEEARDTFAKLLQ